MGLWHSHPAFFGILCFYVVSAAVNALPTPTDQNSPFYHWLFKFANIALANAMRIPEIRTLVGAQSAPPPKETQPGGVQ